MKRESSAKDLGEFKRSRAKHPTRVANSKALSRLSLQENLQEGGWKQRVDRIFPIVKGSSAFLCWSAGNREGQKGEVLLS